MEEVNYAKTGLTEATVLDIVAKAGSVAAVLNTRHAIAKEKGWVASLPSAAAFAKVRGPAPWTVARLSAALVGRRRPAGRWPACARGRWWPAWRGPARRRRD